MGRRISKTVGATTTNYIMAGGNVIAEYQGSTLQRRYVYGPGVDRPIAMITPDGSGIDREYYQYDGQDSVIALVDDSHNLTGAYAYDPYGKVDQISGTTGNVYRYTGRRLDAETGLYYYRARYYDPDMGRFISADPIGYGDGLNMYAYTGNDPVNRVDPSGLDYCDENPTRCYQGESGSAASYNSGVNHFTSNEMKAFNALKQGIAANAFSNTGSARSYARALNYVAGLAGLDVEITFTPYYVSSISVNSVAGVGGVAAGGLGIMIPIWEGSSAPIRLDMEMDLICMLM